MKEIIEKIQAKRDQEPAIKLNLAKGIDVIFGKRFFHHEVIEDKLKTLLDHLINFHFINAETWQVENNIVVCERNKHRSLYDIYLISKYYWNLYEADKSIFSLEAVIFKLIELADEEKIHTMYCGTTLQRVYRPQINERFYKTKDTSLKKLDKDLLEAEKATQIDFEKLVKYYNECKKEQLVIN